MTMGWTHPLIFDKYANVAYTCEYLTNIAVVNCHYSSNKDHFHSCLGKLAKPRQLHNSQWGMMCPAETPEGQVSAHFVDCTI